MRNLYQRLIKDSSSADIQSALIEILPIVSRPDDWGKLFHSDDETEQILNYLCSKPRGNSLAFSQGPELGSELLHLQAAQIQTSAKLLLQPNLANIQNFSEGTFELVLSNAASSSPQIQVRCSQAVRDLAEFLLENAEQYDMLKAEKLLAAIIDFAKSDKLKVAANGLRALAFFLG